jgi:hypothetical protein
MTNHPWKTIVVYDVVHQKEGVELFQISKDKTGSLTFDTVYIKDNNNVAVSSADGDKHVSIIVYRDTTWML